MSRLITRFNVGATILATASAFFSVTASAQAALDESCSGDDTECLNISATGFYQPMAASFSADGEYANTLYVTNSGGAGYGIYVKATGTSGTAIYGSGTEIGVSGGGTVGVVGGGTGSYGVEGYSDTSDGVYGTSTSGDGVRGVAGSGSASGVRGSSATSTGYGVYGSNTDGSIGVYGTASGGTVGTGGATGAYAGYFSGAVRVTGAIYCGSGCSSDERLKKHIEPLTGALDQLLQLHGVTFEWRDPTGRHEGTQTGVIAQQVEKVFPQWIGEDDKGFKTVDPDARTMVGLTVESFRTQQAEIEQLREQVRVLQTGNPISASTGFNFSGNNLGLLGLAAAIAYATSRRRKSVNAS